MRKHAQMTTFDLATAVVVMMIIFAVFIISLNKYIEREQKPEAIDTYLMFKNLEANIRANPTYDGKKISFMNNSVIDLKKLAQFGRMSQKDPELFQSYFFGGTEEKQAYDIAFFLLDENRSYVNISESPVRFIYGNLSNTTDYSDFEDSQVIVGQYNLTPCHYYDNVITMTKPVYNNRSYYTLYFLFCS